MSSKKQRVIENITLGKLVHGGQSMAKSPEGKSMFVWGGLPEEVVDVRVTKKKGSYLEAIVTEVTQQSKNRITPKEPESYLSTSPWQIMTFVSENESKQAILSESFSREGLDSAVWKDFIYGKNEFGYRNKQEFGFWGDDDGLHLAHFVRGSHSKQKVEGSALCADAINIAARDVRDELNSLDVWAGKLKTLVLRSSKASEVVGALFLSEEFDLSNFKLPKSLKGLAIYYSDPKSPASVITKKLYALGDIKLVDSISDINITYDVNSFFQVNLEVFELALQQIKKLLKKADSIDMYSGVGTIGITVGASALVESDKSNIAMAKLNCKGSKTEVIEATAENAVDYIASDKILIVDPPRAGLHKKVIDRIEVAKPPKIIYLSCNSSTQARDIKYLSELYKITYAQGYNFFPRTPHIESLIMLELK